MKKNNKKKSIKENEKIIKDEQIKEAIQKTKEAKEETGVKDVEEAKSETKEKESEEIKEDTKKVESSKKENSEDGIFKNIKEESGDNKKDFKEILNNIYVFLMEKPMKSSLILSFICLMFLESMSRRSFFDAVGFIFSKAGSIFILNWLIVLAPFLLVLVVSKRIAIYCLSVVLWFAIAITDFCMLSNRTTPFTGVDILELEMSELKVAFEYVGFFVGALIVGGIIIALVGVVFLFVFSKSAKRTIATWKSGLIVLGSWIGIYLIVILAIKVNILSTRFSNLGIAYHDYGIAYCFTVTVVDTGISEPANYSEEKVVNVVKEEKNNTKSNKRPNVIFLQLESFIDPKEIKGVNYSEDPIPYYRKLREKYSSGYITVPTVVAGTCNTEFEIITGMNLGFFGPGEYPYKTILKSTTCESMAYDLKRLGYATHAVHNHTTAFYGRNNVYANMGFDTFTGIEMMHDYKRTQSNRWTNDDVLPDCVMDCLKSTKNSDLIYAISVQCHGPYTYDLLDKDKVISVSGIKDKELAKNYEYFVNMEKQEDDFIKDLISKLEKFDEDVVLVMYGDHIPGLGLSDESFDNKTIYETEYVIWDNMGLKKNDKNIKSYQIAADVFDRIGIHEGTIFKYHQEKSDEEKKKKDYLDNLLLLQYDMLYGNRYTYKYAYGDKKTFKRTDIKYGVKDININKVNYSDGELYIEGGAFNEYTKIYIGDKEYETELISSSLLKLKIEKSDLGDNAKIVAKQLSSGGDSVYYETKEFDYKVN